MIDTYTKVILTVIAVSLSTIAFKDFFVTPVNAGIDGVGWKGFYSDKSFRMAVIEVLTEDCNISGYGYVYDDSGNVDMNLKHDCSYW